MKRVGLVRTVRELLRCLIVAASFAMCYTLHFRVAAAAPFSTRVDLLVHSRGPAQSKLSIDHILSADNHRVAFVIAKLYAGSSEYAQMQSSQQLQSPLYSGQIIGGVNYVMKVGLGTPARDLFLVIDTGSTLAWTQCRPCNSCYPQHGRIFDPTASSSYKQVPCASPKCAQLNSSLAAIGTCSRTHAANCNYLIPYLDNSSTSGDFALDALSIGGNTVSAAFPFGCGHRNRGLFRGIDGIVGLSRDFLALPVQMKAEFSKVFAYCMPPIFSSSAGYIEFGASSRGGKGSMTTPLVGLGRLRTFYVVELENVQVEGANCRSKAATRKQMVVDSGTVITRLDKPLYEKVRDAFIKKAAPSFKEAPEGAGLGLFETCYVASSTSILFPRITFTFAGGLTFTPSAQNSVFPIDDNGTFCLAILPGDFVAGVSILGNYQQQGHLFTFDVARSTLSISSNAC